MRTHVTIVGWLHIILNVCHLLIGLAMLAFFVFAGALASTAQGSPGLLGLGILGSIGLLIFGIFAVLSIPGIIIGWGLVNFKPWARVLGIVSSIFVLFSPGFGTALGIYGLIVLFDSGTVALFEEPTSRINNY